MSTIFSPTAGAQPTAPSDRSAQGGIASTSPPNNGTPLLSSTNSSATSSPSASTSERIVDAFLSRYPREYDYWCRVAGWVKDYVQLLLEGQGIRAIVTSRAKDPARLDVKMRKRAITAQWADDAAMLQEVVDIAGVRVALYFPDDRARVNTLIQQDKCLRSLKVKQFPEGASGTSGASGGQSSGIVSPVVHGYGATHHRVQLVKEELPVLYKHYALAHCVEIQVASLLMHAWAEVGHDLVYKDLTGPVSKLEMDCVNSCNALVVSAEQQLTFLQKATADRLASSQAAFLNHYELGAWLLSHEQIRQRTIPVGPVEEMFNFLEGIGLNYASKLAPFVQKMLQDPSRLTPLLDISLVQHLVPHITRDNAEWAVLWERALCGSDDDSTSESEGEEQQDPHKMPASSTTSSKNKRTRRSRESSERSKTKSRARARLGWPNPNSKPSSRSGTSRGDAADADEGKL